MSASKKSAAGKAKAKAAPKKKLKGAKGKASNLAQGGFKRGHEIVSDLA